jgi:hypothetical protein
MEPESFAEGNCQNSLKLGNLSLRKDLWMRQSFGQLSGAVWESVSPFIVITIPAAL